MTLLDSSSNSPEQKAWIGGSPVSDGNNPYTNGLPSDDALPSLEGDMQDYIRQSADMLNVYDAAPPAGAVQRPVAPSLGVKESG